MVQGKRKTKKTNCITAYTILASNQDKSNSNKDLKALKCFVKEAHIDTKSPKENPALPFNVQKFCYSFNPNSPKMTKLQSARVLALLFSLTPHKLKLLGCRPIIILSSNPYIFISG